MRRFSFRPALTLRGRTFKGLRGWAGKPLHPPLTDVPVGAYMLAAAFDVISFAGGDDQAWARDFYRAASFRSEEHTSELQSLMRISYAVFCLKKKKTYNKRQHIIGQFKRHKYSK